jgi:hypothetical protein
VPLGSAAFKRPQLPVKLLQSRSYLAGARLPGSVAVTGADDEGDPVVLEQARGARLAGLADLGAAEGLGKARPEQLGDPLKPRSRRGRRDDDDHENSLERRGGSLEIRASRRT